jgi:hypothetical protein
MLLHTCFFQHDKQVPQEILQEMHPVLRLSRRITLTGQVRRGEVRECLIAGLPRVGERAPIVRRIT